MNVLVADSKSLFRQSLAQLLAGELDISVAGEAGTVQEAIEKASALKPDIVLMDIFFPDGSGLEAIPVIRSLGPETKILIFTSAKEDDFLFTAIRLGADGYLPNDTPPQQLATALQALNRGEVIIPRGLFARILTEFSRISNLLLEREKLVPFSLTSRELQIMDQLALNATNREIAERLGIAEQTVRAHIYNILKKLGARDRHEAGRRARRMGRGAAVSNNSPPSPDF
jgi:DNA-binding NarL/FixJ family response regulator